METDMGKFFTAISSRMWKENDLSDLTFALCEGNSCFKQFFLDFFFGAGKLDASKAKITREKSMDGSRPDFWITVNGVNYIIEVKIWDNSHHFSQYLPFVDGDRGRLGYVAAYEITADSDGSPIAKEKYPGLKQWKDLILQLSSEVKEDGLGAGDPAIIGYMKYVRKVCGIGEKYDDIDKIERKSFECLYRVCMNIISSVKYCSKCDFYTRSPTNSDFSWRKGSFFRFDYKGREAYGFIGVYFGGAKEDPYFVVEFDNAPGWGDRICKDCNSIDEKLRFYPDEQTIETGESLGQFLDAVIDGVASGNIDGLSRVKPTYPSLSMLKCVQLLDRKLRNGFLNFAINDGACNVKYYPNSRTWWGAVGEYFEITLPNDEVTWGWTGVTYAEGKVAVVLRFRLDWAGPFKNIGEIVLWEGTEDVFAVSDYLLKLKKSLNKLIEQNYNTVASVNL